MWKFPCLGLRRKGRERDLLPCDASGQEGTQEGSVFTDLELAEMEIISQVLEVEWKMITGPRCCGACMFRAQSVEIPPLLGPHVGRGL